MMEIGKMIKLKEKEYITLMMAVNIKIEKLNQKEKDNDAIKDENMNKLNQDIEQLTKDKIDFQTKYLNLNDELNKEKEESKKKIEEINNEKNELEVKIKAKEEKRKKEEMEEKIRIENILKQLPPEPSDDDPNKCTIMFRFPDGEKTVQRKFLKSDKISLLYTYVKSLGKAIYNDPEDEGFSLVQPFPFKNFNDLQENTLEQEGMFPNAVLQIRTVE